MYDISLHAEQRSKEAEEIPDEKAEDEAANPPPRPSHRRTSSLEVHTIPIPTPEPREEGARDGAEPATEARPASDGPPGATRPSSGHWQLKGSLAWIVLAPTCLKDDSVLSAVGSLGHGKPVPERTGVTASPPRSPKREAPAILPQSSDVLSSISSKPDATSVADVRPSMRCQIHSEETCSRYKEQMCRGYDRSVVLHHVHQRLACFSSQDPVLIESVAAQDCMAYNASSRALASSGKPGKQSIREWTQQEHELKCRAISGPGRGRGAG